jgi:MFS family permease
VSPHRRSLNPFRVLLTHANFRRFWVGQTLSLIGTWMQSMALGWLALELSDSAFIVGLVASIGSLPILLFSLYAGVVVDRSDKLRLVTIAQTLLLLEAVLLWYLTWSGHINIPTLLVLALVGGAIASVEIPARQSLMIDLVGRDDLRDAIALNSSGFNLARIFGPAIAARHCQVRPRLVLRRECTELPDGAHRPVPHLAAAVHPGPRPAVAARGDS